MHVLIFIGLLSIAIFLVSSCNSVNKFMKNGGSESFSIGIEEHHSKGSKKHTQSQTGE